MPFYGETVHNTRPHGFIPPAQPTFFTKVKQWVHGRREPELVPSWNPERYTQPPPGRQRAEFTGPSQAFPAHPTLPAGRPVDQAPKKKHWPRAPPVQPNPLTPPHPHPYNVPPWEREELYPYHYPVSPAYPPTLIDYKYLRVLEIAPSENTRDPELPHYHPLGPGIFPVEGHRSVNPPQHKTQRASNPTSRSSSARPVPRRTSTPHPERSKHRSLTPPAPAWAHTTNEPETTPEAEEPIHFALGTSRARSWLHNNQPQASRPLKHSLLPELMPTADDDYPAMHWLVICPIESAVRLVAADTKSTLHLATPAITPPFTGEVKIRTKGEDAHLAYIINRYGPIRVVANEFLTVGHILQAIREYFCTSVDRESFHDLNDRDRFMISHYYHFRTQFQGQNIRGTVLPLFDHKKAIRSDLLHGAIKFAGLEIDGEFSRNRTLYLTTKIFVPLQYKY